MWQEWYILPAEEKGHHDHAETCGIDRDTHHMVANIQPRVLKLIEAATKK